MDWPRLQDLTKTLADSDIVINSTKFSIGRGLHNSLVIPHISVSRTHCTFEKIEGGKWCLFDKSSNGTVINGYLLNKGAVHILNDSDTIEVGETAKFTYRAPGLGTNTQLIDLTEQDVMNIADAIIAQVERGDDRCIEIKTTDAVSNSEPERKCMPEASSSRMCEKKKDEEPSEPEPKKKLKFGDMEDDLACSICSEMFIKPVTLQCSHTFCSYCIDEWEKRRRKQCPICRAMLKARFPTLILNNVIDKVLETASDEVIKRRNEEIERRDKLEKQAPSSHKSGPGPARHRTVSGRSVRRTSGSREPSSHNGPSATLVVSIENETLSVSTSAPPAPLALDELLERFSSASSWEEDDDDDDDNLSEDSFTSLEFEESPYPNYNGLPGAYFGGYGRCHVCGDPNHWAGGCPDRAMPPGRRRI